MCKVMNSLVKLFGDEERSVQDRYMIGKALIEQIEKELDGLKPEVEKLEVGTYENKDCDKKLIVGSTSKSTLNDRKIAEELTLEELRLTYKATEKALNAIGKGDLVAKYKTTTEVKSIKVLKL